MPADGFLFYLDSKDLDYWFVAHVSYVSNGAAAFGNSERTSIMGRICGGDGGWRIALNFWFFFLKKKEKEIKK